MSAARTGRPIRLRIGVLVTIDPADEELVGIIQESAGELSVADVVCSEIESNLESVPYVEDAVVGVLNMSRTTQRRTTS